MKRAVPIRLNALCVAIMTKAMLEGPCTTRDLMEASGLQGPAIGRYIRALRKEKAVHIAEWEQDSIGRYVIPAFVLGEGKDKPRPPRERLRKRRDRAKRDAQVVMNHMLAGKIEAKTT